MVVVGASSVAGCAFRGAARFRSIGHLLPPPRLRAAALGQMLGRDHAGAAASGAVGVLIALCLIEDHLQLVI